MFTRVCLSSRCERLMNPIEPVGEKLPSPGFEGAEKLLEVWFKPAAGVPKVERPGLFKVSREDWVEMLKLVRCEIIGFASNGELDSYLLRYFPLSIIP